MAALSRFDRACLRFLRFVVARRVIACCLITAFYVILAGTGVALGCLDLSPNYQYEWVIDAKRSTRNHDARQAAVAAADPLAAMDTAPRAREYLPTWVEYETTSHIFTPANLQKICDVEMNFYSAPILCSFCFSFGFVMPLLAAAGPSGDRCGFRFHAPARVAAAPAGTPSPQLIYPINVGAGGAVPVDPAADELPAPLTVYPPSPLIVTTPLRRVYKKCRRYT